MCGIAGYVSNLAPPDQREAAVARMQYAMQHRGPDGEGLTTRGIATLGVRRLAVFDPARGHQPVCSRDGRYTLVFNGALYNFRVLREELRRRGHAFATDCDTEVLLAAWTEWQDGALARLRGMFAFAVWDEVRRTLVLARDPFGIKPLYVRAAPAELLFASELNALIASGAFTSEIDPAAVDAYLCHLAVPAPGTIYQGVSSLRPGEWACWQEGMLEVHAGWRFPARSRTVADGSEADFLAGLRQQLEDSVAAHCLADVPVGAFLSGGLDSAAIVGVMARAGGGKLKTFSLGFAEAEFSEAEPAAATARHYGTEHHPRLVTGSGVAAALDDFVASLDQPTGDGLNTYLVSQAAHAGGVTVALSGLGGDELFGGYRSFRRGPWITRALQCWRHLPLGWQGAIRQQLRRGGVRRQKLADLLGAPANLHHVAVHQRRVLSEDVRRGLLVHAGESGCEHPELDRLPHELAAAAPAAVISAWELRTYLADVLLRDSDIMSMRHSLELRLPFIDRPLIEWLWAQPAQFRFTPHAPKSALARALADVLPPGVRARRKQGFSLPMDAWMRTALRPFLQDVFAPAYVARTGLLQPGAVAQLWQDFQTGADRRLWSRVWSTAVLIAFLNRRRPA